MNNVFTLTVLLSVMTATTNASEQAAEKTYKMTSTIIPKSTEAVKTALAESTKQHDACGSLGEQLTYEKIDVLLSKDLELFKAIKAAKHESQAAMMHVTKFEIEFAKDNQLGAIFAYKLALQEANVAHTFQSSDLPVNPTTFPNAVQSNLDNDLKKCSKAIKTTQFLKNICTYNSRGLECDTVPELTPSPQELYKLANDNFLAHQGLWQPAVQ